MLRELKKAPWWVWLLLAGFSVFVIVGIVSAATDQSENTDEPTNLAAPTAIPTEAPVAEPTATDTPEPPPTPENIEPWRADLHAVVDVIRQACSGHVEIEDCLANVKYVQQSLFLVHPEGQPICVAGARYAVMLGTQDIAWDVAGALVGGEHGTLAELYASIDALDTTIDEVLDEDCWFGFGIDDTPEAE
jgi:hypothetical protein